MATNSFVGVLSKRLGVLVSLSLAFGCTSCATPGGTGSVRHLGSGNNPQELGVVEWNRGFDDAVRRARKVQKPLLVLFQEVPGCSTCTDYGDHVLSHPLIVDAAETLFVPVAVYNNIEGDDERILKMFNEPSWNNPVVLIMTPDKRPLAPRVADDYSAGKLAEAMVAALVTQNRTVPAYLGLLAQQGGPLKGGSRSGSGSETATLAMHCFWEGESALGNVPGILSTRAGFVGKDEVVELTFDRRRIDYAAVVKAAQKLDCASKVYTRDDRQQRAASQIVSANAIRSDERVRPDKQPKYYLGQTSYRFVPMTELQAMRVNHAIHEKKDVDVSLSPSQLKLLKIVRRHPSAGWQNAIGASDIAASWKHATLIARSVGESL